MTDLQKPQTPESDDEIHLLDYLIVLAKHSRMIIYTTVTVSALTLLILFFMPNQYTATARILPPQQNNTISGQLLDSLGVNTFTGASSGGLGGMASSIMGLKSPTDLYVGMLTGHTIFDRMINRFNLRDYYKSWYNINYHIEDLRKDLEKASNITTGKEGLIEIEVTDEDPKMAAAMANAFAEELGRLQQEIGHQDAQNQLAFLEKERNQTINNLGKAEEALRNFSEKSSVIQIDAQTKGMLEYVATLRGTIDAKEVQIQVMRQQATPFNYDLIRIETELKGLKEKLRATEMQADQTYFGDVCLATSKVPALGLEYIRLYREVKYQDTLYQLYCKLTELARLDSARNVMVNTIQFCDRATPPEKKSKPKKIIISILVGFATLFVMMFTAFVREYWQNTTNSADEAEAHRMRQLSSYAQKWRGDALTFLSWFKRKKLR